MSQQFTNQVGLSFTLAPEPFATGGEGGVYDVLSPDNSGLVAKIYHNAELALERKEKIAFMHANNPTDTADPEVKKAIVWVEEILYNQEQEFVGFLMPKVRDSISLKSLTLVQNLSKKHGKDWKKFDHNVKGSHQKRLVVAYNLAQAINAIHERGNYVLVDMKPENVFVRPDASISLVDLDSIQINSDEEGSDLNFPAKVLTEEYVPPEKYYESINHRKGTIKEAWDYFSLSVIIYELLFGIHPFQASHKTLTTRSELIQGGYFVQGSKKVELHKIPHFHQNFGKLPERIQEHFYDTFEKGHNAPQMRTTPKQWVDTLYEAIQLRTVQKTVINVQPLGKAKANAKLEVESKTPQFDSVVSHVNQVKGAKLSMKKQAALDKKLFALFGIGVIGYIVSSIALSFFIIGGILNAALVLLGFFLYQRFIIKGLPMMYFEEWFQSSFLIFGVFSLLATISIMPIVAITYFYKLIEFEGNAEYVLLGMIVLGCLFVAKKYQLKHHDRFIKLLED